MICQLIGLFLARFFIEPLNSTGHKHCSCSRSDAGFCSDLSQTFHYSLSILFFIFNFVINVFGNISNSAASLGIFYFFTHLNFKFCLQ